MAARSCPTCSAPVASDQRFCLRCGERIVPRRRQAGSRPLIAAALVLAICAVLFLIALLKLRGDAREEVESGGLIAPPALGRPG